MGAVEDRDFAFGGRMRMNAPQKIMGELHGRRLLETRNLDALRVKAGEDMAHGAILAAGVKRLQDDQDRMFFLGVKERLEACEFAPATLDVDCGGLRRFVISLECWINTLELQRLSWIDQKPLAIVHSHLL